MYIIKNAFRCIGRAKGRNILIGIIALVIAVSACIGLSIRQAAKNAQESTLAEMSVTATISFDRRSMMGNMQPPERGEGGSFDREQFREMMGESSGLTLEEYETFAKAESVSDFYYTLTAYLNGNEELLPVTTEAETESSGSNGGFDPSQMGGMMGGMPGGMGGFSSSDFTLVGYSSDSAMTDFANGTTSITDGAVFEEGTTAYECIISKELAIYNNLAVGDTITLLNPEAEEETYTLTVCGIYSSESSNEFSMSRFGAGQDPANRIYLGAAALQQILDASAEAEDTALNSTLAGTYVFATADDYYAFEEQARDMGLEDSYTISSTDITAFENSLAPLNTLSTSAGWFLLVILAIGAVILVVLNIFNVRERKYEIGVLTAMGMKKGKVATQFLCEILVVTMIAIFIGTTVGAVCAVPVTNALLENQIANQNSQLTQIEENFGRPNNMGGGMPGGMPGGMGGGMGGGMPNMQMPDNMDNEFFGKMFGSAEDYITQVDSAMDLTVVLQMVGIGLGLTLVASTVSVLFVMRYDPLKILANRD